MLFAPAEEGEHRRRIVTGLPGQLRKIDGAAVNARRRTGFQPPCRQFQFTQARRQTDRRRIPRAATLIVLQADVDQSRKEGSRRQHHGLSFKTQANLGDNTGNAIALHHQIIHGLLKYAQIGLVLDAATDGLPI